MKDRDTILKRVRDGLAETPERTPYPEYDPACAVMRQPHEFSSLWELFAWRMKSVNGVPLHGWNALGDFLRERALKFGYCDPEYTEAIAAVCGSLDITERFDRNDLDRYEFGITAAAGAIAETGTIVLTDAATRPRLAALAPWIHIAILQEDDIWPDSPTALKRLGDDPSVIWVTGPSKTADVEGILIEGVHGPGVQVCCVV